ncbi:MAG: tetratricopeptide repeat protein [Spirochaetaceae bacterium]|nr:MAG: tetratricopeptide repeat protein [Spirochaetaceae bacterium]
MRTRASLLLFSLLNLLWATPAGAQSAENLFEAGRKAFQDGMYVMAARNFRELADQYPDSPFADDAEYLSGVADFYLGEFQSCVATLKNYARRYPRSSNNSRVSYWLGSAYFQLLNYPEALSQLRNQVEKYQDEQPYNDHALLLKGMVEENLSQWAAARESYQRILSRDSARELWPEALYRFGGLALRASDYTDALTAFSRIIVEFSASPYAAEAVFFVGECHFFLGRYTEAERSFRSVLASEPPLEQWETSLYRLALILQELGRSAQALEMCTELERRFPRSRYRDSLARLKADLLFDLKRYPEAFDAYGKSLQAGIGMEERQVIYYNMGLAAFLSGDLRRCLEPLEKALQGRPEIAEQSLFRLSAAQAELGLVQLAADHFEEFLRRYPSSQRREEATRILAALYFENGDSDKAEPLYTKLITRYPDSSYQDEYLFKRGSTQLQRGSAGSEQTAALAAALKDFYTLIERWPDSPYLAESSYNIGYIYSRRGEYKRASPFFEDVLQAEPSPELAGRAILAAGVCAFNAGEYEQAIEWFRKNAGGPRTGMAYPSVDRSNPASAWTGESWFYLGRTHYKLEQLEKAADTFGRAAELLEGTAQGEEAQFWKGLSEFRLNRLEQAKESFLILTRRYPGGQRLAESYYRAGICAFQTDSYLESIDHYDRALQTLSAQMGTYGDNLKQEILYQKGLSFLQAGERDQALKTYESLSREFPKSTLASEAFFKIAEEDFRNGRYRSAADGFALVKERFPDTPAAASALYWAGLSAAREGDRSGALEYLIAFLEGSRDSRDLSAGGLAELAMQEIRGILSALGSDGRSEEGKIFEEFYRRVDRSPSLDQAFRNRIRFEYARYIFPGTPEGAMAILQTVRAEDPVEPLASEVSFLIGEYYRLNGELDRAFDIFTGIIAANSGQPGAASQLGIARVLEARAQSQEAAEEYLKVHFLYPDHAELAAEGLYSAGRLYWEEGYRDRAGQLFKRLKDEYPDSPLLDKIPEP